jgi:hypothetical protein
MKPYQERVIQEKAELDMKREALDAFINSDTFDGLTYLDQSLLVVQADAMMLYSGVLTQRIHQFHRNN